MRLQIRNSSGEKWLADSLVMNFYSVFIGCLSRCLLKLREEKCQCVVARLVSNFRNRQFRVCQEFACMTYPYFSKYLEDAFVGMLLEMPAKCRRVQLYVARNVLQRNLFLEVVVKKSVNLADRVVRSRQNVCTVESYWGKKLRVLAAIKSFEHTQQAYQPVGTCCRVEVFYHFF